MSSTNLQALAGGRQGQCSWKSVHSSAGLEETLVYIRGLQGRYWGYIKCVYIYIYKKMEATGII